MNILSVDAVQADRHALKTQRVAVVDGREAQQGGADSKGRTDHFARSFFTRSSFRRN